MQKKVLSEKALYQGKVLMPKGFEINPFILSKSIFESTYMGKDFIFTSNWDRLNKYLIEHIRLKYKLNLVNKKSRYFSRLSIYIKDIKFITTLKIILITIILIITTFINYTSVFSQILKFDTILYICPISIRVY